MSMSSGSRVRRLGTMAMSSKPYARRPLLPMPISTSATGVLRMLEPAPVSRPGAGIHVGAASKKDPATWRRVLVTVYARSYQRAQAPCNRAAPGDCGRREDLDLQPLYHDEVRT